VRFMRRSFNAQMHEIKFRSESIYVFFYGINYGTTIIFRVITSGRKAIKPKRIAVARASIWRTVCIASRSWRPQNVFQRILPRYMLSIHLEKLAMIYVKSDRLSLWESLEVLFWNWINSRQPAGAFDIRNFNYGINEVAC